MTLPEARFTNNFDFIRLTAAAFVLAGHSSDVLLNEPLAHDPARFLFGFSLQSFGVLIFFIISGYLVTGSFESRKSIPQYFLNRVLRIFPALIVVVLLTVFVLGPLVTVLPLHEYFSSHLTRQYLQNMTLYRMYYYLPGVFSSNPIGGSVNASLWTLPYEFTCYLYVGLAGIVTLLRNKWVSLVLFIGYFISYLLFREPLDTVVIPLLGIDFKTFFIPFLYFLSGSVFYMFRSSVRYTGWGLSGCVLIALLVKTGWLHPQFLIPAITYLVLSFAFSRHIRLHRIATYGDFSYGLYLYAFPVQQLLMHALPFRPELWLMMVLSFLCTFPFAFASWKLVEKPALNLRHRLWKK